VREGAKAQGHKGAKEKGRKGEREKERKEATVHGESKGAMNNKRQLRVRIVI